MTARDHNNLLGIFFMIQGGLAILIGLMLGIMYGVMGVVMVGAAAKDGGAAVGGIFIVLAFVVGGIVVLLGALDLYTGSRVRKVAPIGRTLGIVISILSLFSFPLGTALGIYGLWFLLGDMGKSLYLGSAAPTGNYGSPNQPPPGNWA
ncbi:MAG: hypothetical protein JO314_03540 [Acidobacteria bacterium]|nr:hypothetical protein [Acidobacteriota bacterium]